MRVLEPACLIVSAAEDLHAFGVRQRLREIGVPTEVVCTDRLGDVQSLVWSPEGAIGVLPNEDGVPVAVGSASVVWWRRQARSVPQSVTEDVQLRLIANDCEAALTGIVETDFGGVWIDHPFAIRRGENKLVQLRLAQHMGIRYPATLVTQDYEQLRLFAAQHGRIVAKVLRGAYTSPLATVAVAMTELQARSVGMCPTIYQEEIPGSRHLRVVVFGDAVYPFSVTSPHLDWRPHSNNGVELVPIPEPLRAQLLAFLAALDLHMGSFDLKVTPENEIVFLEVNPQGQFLFLQQKTDVDLALACAQYLAAQAAAR